jgi:outer membrane protein TolC
MQLKKELLQAEVRHAKARAAVSGSEADVKVINARLRALTK